MTFLDQIKKVTGYDKLENWLNTKPVFASNPNIQYNSNRTYLSSGLMRYKEELAQSPLTETRAITPNIDTRAIDPMTAVAAGISTAGNIYTNIQNAAAQRAINNDNMMMQKQAQEYNKAMVDYANYYNTPYNQYQRQLDAGINPYAALGAIQGYSGEIAQSPSAPNLTAPQIQNPVSQLGSFFSMNLNKELKERELDIAQQNADTLKQTADSEQSYKDSLKTNLEETNKNLSELREQIKAYTNLLRQKEKTEVQTTKYKQMENEIYEEFGHKNAQATYKELVSRFNLNEANARYLWNEIHFKNQQLHFQLLSAMRDFSRVINDSITVFNNTKLADSLSRMQDSITSLNSFDLKGMKPIQLQLLQNTLKYDDEHKLFDIITHGIGTFNQSMDFVHDPLGVQRRGLEIFKALK